MEPGILIRLPGTSSISKCQFEDSLQTAVRVSTRAILFLKERATCDLTIYIYIYLYIFFYLFIFFFFFDGPRSREMSLYLPGAHSEIIYAAV